MKGNASGYIRFKLTDVSNLMGKTIKFSCDLKTESSLNLRLFYNIAGTYSWVGTNVPANSEDNFNVEYLVNNNVSELLFNVNYSGGSSTDDIIFYTDNWCLTVID